MTSDITQPPSGAFEHRLIGRAKDVTGTVIAIDATGALIEITDGTPIYSDYIIDVGEGSLDLVQDGRIVHQDDIRSSFGTDDMPDTLKQKFEEIVKQIETENARKIIEGTAVPEEGQENALGSGSGTASGFPVRISHMVAEITDIQTGVDGIGPNPGLGPFDIRKAQDLVIEPQPEFVPQPIPEASIVAVSRTEFGDGEEIAPQFLSLRNNNNLFSKEIKEQLAELDGAHPDVKLAVSVPFFDEGDNQFEDSPTVVLVPGLADATKYETSVADGKRTYFFSNQLIEDLKVEGMALMEVGKTSLSFTSGFEADLMDILSGTESLSIDVSGATILLNDLASEIQDKIAEIQNMESDALSNFFTQNQNLENWLNNSSENTSTTNMLNFSSNQDAIDALQADWLANGDGDKDTIPSDLININAALDVRVENRDAAQIEYLKQVGSREALEELLDNTMLLVNGVNANTSMSEFHAQLSDLLNDVEEELVEISAVQEALNQAMNGDSIQLVSALGKGFDFNVEVDVLGGINGDVKLLETAQQQVRVDARADGLQEDLTGDLVEDATLTHEFSFGRLESTLEFNIDVPLADPDGSELQVLILQLPKGVDWSFDTNALPSGSWSSPDDGVMILEVDPGAQRVTDSFKLIVDNTDLQKSDISEEVITLQVDTTEVPFTSAPDLEKDSFNNLKQEEFTVEALAPLPGRVILVRENDLDRDDSNFADNAFSQVGNETATVSFNESLKALAEFKAFIQGNADPSAIDILFANSAIKVMISDYEGDGLPDLLLPDTNISFSEVSQGVFELSGQDLRDFFDAWESLSLSDQAELAQFVVVPYQFDGNDFTLSVTEVISGAEKVVLEPIEVVVDSKAQGLDSAQTQLDNLSVDIDRVSFDISVSASAIDDDGSENLSFKLDLPDFNLPSSVAPDWQVEGMSADWQVVDNGNGFVLSANFADGTAEFTDDISISFSTDILQYLNANDNPTLDIGGLVDSIDVVPQDETDFDSVDNIVQAQTVTAGSLDISEIVGRVFLKKTKVHHLIAIPYLLTEMPLQLTLQKHLNS